MARMIRIISWLCCCYYYYYYAIVGGVMAFSTTKRPLHRYHCHQPQTQTQTQPPRKIVLRATRQELQQQQEEEEISCNVAIFGGGFGGLYTALQIAATAKGKNNKNRPGRQQGRTSRKRQQQQQQQYAPLDIVLVDPSDRFVFLPLLYDLVQGTATRQEVCPTYRSVLQGTGIRHVQGTLQNITGTTATIVRRRTTTTTTTTFRSESETNRAQAHEKGTTTTTIINFDQGVLAVGATPTSILQTTPGANLVQPFYTAQHAMETRDLLNRLDRQILGNPNHNNNDKEPLLKIAVVGGGYGGVELAACLQRRFATGSNNNRNKNNAAVTLLARSPPLQGTRVQPIVRQALADLGVHVEISSVKAVEKAVVGGVNHHHHQDDDAERTATTTTTRFPKEQIVVLRQVKKAATTTTTHDNNNDDDNNNNKDSTIVETTVVGSDQVWDAIFWTAGSGPAEPVSNTAALVELERIQGRLATDRTLRCNYNKNFDPSMTSSSSSTTTTTNPSTLRRRRIRSNQQQQQPPLWALGDCATMVGGAPTPKTAQAAMQQADVVAYNVLLEHYGTTAVPASNSRRMPTRAVPRTFVYQDLGSMMNLGGTNGVIAAPPDSSALGPVFAPLLDTARIGLGVADSFLKELASDQSSSSSSSMLANLSLGVYGLGVQDDNNDDYDDERSPSRGSLAGTLAGAARRAVYAARMPTNRQRVYSAASAALSTALTLAKEASDNAPTNRRQEDK